MKHITNFIAVALDQQTFYVQFFLYILSNSPVAARIHKAWRNYLELLIQMLSTLMYIEQNYKWSLVKFLVQRLLVK